MKIYIAAPFAARPYAKRIAEALQNAGHVVTSTWVLSERAINAESIGTSPVTTQRAAEDHAWGDFNDIDRADILLHITSSAALADNPDLPEEWLHTGGRHVEVGWALATDTPVHYIGEPENIFARTMCNQVTLDEFFGEIGE